ncbi:MAG: Flp pilus assembly complex ATPase component TadA [Elusimicrobia bacterium]|jgi:type II secretory ATPase GspE/PulE/Tfp pilus assembly ATPase PilB-like protein|nr:Flp pilus assembly complex ATPase component TadA [Elusimicrobiota bacterium]MBK7544260.1 Flp pilus assembly complex ATPase component TadA [Elusimicrobiota bacterium]MBK7573782.1 Flp pilus assembly complex ATPase component TadA [Elusimicrobiota bacterium]MBK7689380.1 Flp pilus assembly complex ATPase component TadA [Elusimicrobiota bacterium]MBK8125926.1 Flp pilus assembly complex ATPase component TadA [Elusimicrobiota bacterium]
MAQRASSNRKTIKDILAGQNLISPVDMAKAEAEAEKTKRPLQQVVVDLGFVDKLSVLQAIAAEWEVQPVLFDDVVVDGRVAKLISDAMARKHNVLPFLREDGIILLAMADPRDPLLLEDVRAKTGEEVRPFLAMPGDIEKELDRIYGTALDHDEAGGGEGDGHDAVERKTQEMLGDLLDGVDDIDELTKKTDLMEVDASAPEVERIVNAIILAAMQIKASDIHIEPFEDPAGKKNRIVVRFRVDGFLKEAPFRIPWSYRNAIIAKIKILTASMNLTERRIPQSGRIEVMAKGRPIEFRVETIPTVYGESASLRLLDRKSVQVDIHKLGFLDDILERLLDQLKGIGGKKNYGMILVTGPTGSGKTTTLYACLNHVNRPDIRVITAENPVEYNIDGIIQVAVNPDITLAKDRVFNFATALRSFLRLDPDVIMVGEVRDKETATIAMEAAMTGHLVLSTIHTNDAASTVSRLAEMGPPAYLVASTLKCVLAQRLCRLICPDCKAPAPLTADEREIFRLNGFELTEETTIYKGAGCKACSGTGLRGRLGIHELLIMDETVRRVALSDLTADSIRNAAIYHSPQRMRTMVQDGLIKVLQGLTTINEVLGVSTEKAS